MMNATEGNADVAELSAKKPKRKSSAVTSGRRLFVEGDGRSPWSRRYRDLIAGHVSDLGGHDTLSEAQKSLIRRASAIECELELMEGKLSQGEEIDIDVFTRSSSHLRRIFETLGIERRAKDITSLSDTPLEYMLNTLRDETENTSERMKAAINAAPYVHPKLQNIAHTGDKDSPVVIDTGNMTDVARRIAFCLSQGAAKAE
jgi:hypothetical protein